MPGIAGIVTINPSTERAALEKMLHSMPYRGEPILSIHSFKNVIIGSRGEITCDPPCEIYAVFDGFIINQPDLIKALEKAGRKISKTHPEEIIIQSYLEWGIDFLNHLKGEFAIALLDEKKGKLILARDRIGKKPLYWSLVQNYFLFANEIKALLSSVYIPQTPSMDGLASYLYFGYIPQDMTPIHNVNKLLPGHYLEINFQENMHIKPYWSYSQYFDQSIKDPLEIKLEKFEADLKNSIQSRLSTDTVIGSFLTGDLGSASIAYFLNEYCRGRLQCFTVEFQGGDIENVEITRSIASKLEIPQEIGWIKPENLLEELPRIIWNLEEPLADPEIISTWRIAKMASHKTRTVFSGVGSEEFLAAHARYAINEETFLFLSKLLNLTLSTVRKFFIPILYLLKNRSLYPILRERETDLDSLKYFQRNALFIPSLLKTAAPNLSPYFDPKVFLNKFHNLEKIQSPIAAYIYLDAKTRLVDRSILQYEKLTTAFRLNWQTPYLDRTLIEYLASSMDFPSFQENETALLLKRMFKQIFPEIPRQKKMLRKDFLDSWMNKSNLFEVFALLNHGVLADTGLISQKWIKDQLQMLRKSPKPFPYLWTILILEIWFQIFINKKIEDTPPKMSVKELLS